MSEGHEGHEGQGGAWYGFDSNAETELGDEAGEAIDADDAERGIRRRRVGFSTLLEVAHRSPPRVASYSPRSDRMYPRSP